MADGAGSTGAFIQIFSHGIEFTIISLILAVGTLYLVISIAGYKLRKTVGCILIVAYVFFVTFAILVELDVFFEAPVLPAPSAIVRINHGRPKLNSTARELAPNALLTPNCPEPIIILCFN